MSYTVLARRYRSRDFDEVVGQAAIARTLRNAIDQNRVAHAYLFVGTRGVGKTTMARIFAKALNAGDSDEIAQAIMSGQDMDVIEIDAASHTGVDHAREMIANASLRPMHGGRKIYIIDEVHMLSNQAFNALLKTLEEPPEHVMFILCTTEPHKVLPTIQSRCQRFDFRNIATDEIASHLRHIVDAESVEADDDALHTLARLGNGSMRDALSLLDRLMAARPADEAISVKLIEQILGLPAREQIESLVDSLADADAKAALEATDALVATGIEIEQLLDAVAGRLRDLMVICACGAETRLVEVAGPSRDRAVAQARRFDEAGLCHMIALCEAVQRSVKNSSARRALLDALVVRLAMTEKIASVAALLEGKPSAAAKPASRGSPSKKA